MHRAYHPKNVSSRFGYQISHTSVRQTCLISVRDRTFVSAYADRSPFVVSIKKEKRRPVNISFIRRSATYVDRRTKRPVDPPRLIRPVRIPSRFHFWLALKMYANQYAQQYSQPYSQQYQQYPSNYYQMYNYNQPPPAYNAAQPASGSAAFSNVSVPQPPVTTGGQNVTSLWMGSVRADGVFPVRIRPRPNRSVFFVFFHIRSWNRTWPRVSSRERFRKWANIQRTSSWCAIRTPGRRPATRLWTFTIRFP